MDGHILGFDMSWNECYNIGDAYLQKFCTLYYRFYWFGYCISVWSFYTHFSCFENTLDIFSLE